MGKFVIIFRHETGLDKVKRGFVILFVSCELDEINEKIILDVIKHAKIFLLIETNHMASEIDQIQLAGYKCYNVSRKKRPRGRNSGGIAVYIDTSLLDGVQKIPSSGSENILIKFKKDFFGLS